MQRWIDDLAGDMRFVALDFETANEQRDSACAIGIAVVENRHVVRTLHHLIRPHELRFCSRNIRVHGITPEQVKGAPTLTDVWPMIRPLIENQLVIAHNASFDMSVLRRSLYANGLPIPRTRYLCSLHLARAAWPRLPSHNLGFLAAYHNIELDHHNAESDARAASYITLRIATEHSTDCPFRLAEHLDVTVGRLFPDGNWEPSTAPRIHTCAESCDVILPDDFDVRTHPLHGKNVVFTGSLRLIRRSMAIQIVELFGGSPRSTVSRKTDVLVTGFQDLRKLAAGETRSAKLRRAEELRSAGASIEIITECDFYQMVVQFIGDAGMAEALARTPHSKPVEPERPGLLSRYQSVYF